MTKKPIRIYISCTQLVRTQQSLCILLNRIKQSSLSQCEIHILHSNDWDGVGDFAGLNVYFRNTGYDHKYFEFPALAQVRLDCQKDNFYGLYLHTKGSSKEDETQWQNAVAWIHYMMLGLLDHSEQCLDHLSSGAQLVGSQWYWHFKGNFYWFDSEYLAQLVDPMLMDLDYRNNCEHWCSYSYWWGRYSLPKIRNLFYMPLTSDADYLNLLNQNFYPDFSQKHYYHGTVIELINRGWYGAYDLMRLSDQDIKQFPIIIAKYLNYDGAVINSDTQETYEANYFFHRG